MSAGPPTRPATPPCSSSSAAQPVDTAGLLPKPTIAAHDQPTGSPTRPSAHDDRSELSPEITGSPDHGIPIRSHILGTQPYRRQQYIFRGRSSFSPLRLSQLAPPTLPPRLHETRLDILRSTPPLPDPSLVPSEFLRLFLVGLISRSVCGSRSLGSWRSFVSFAVRLGFRNAPLRS
jgi:hypothetical protein